MEPNNIRLKLGAGSITIGIEMFSGVLTERTFNGKNCYTELLDFLNQIGSKGTLQAEIEIE
ncbi:MAG TPA: hypothetical protein VE130_03085 [Nitrososphaeraceae archaeon]|nr:hypothetical protein [Nitrososphaeraceae archaeon]